LPPVAHTEGFPTAPVEQPDGGAKRPCFFVDSPVAAPPARAPRTSRGARAPRAPRTSAGAAPTLRAARAAARRPRRESIRPSSSRAPLVRAHPLVEAGRARLQRADLRLLLADQDVRDTLCEPQTGKADASGFPVVLHGGFPRSGEAQSPALLRISSRI